jgi:phosphonate transport system substrate-binding protein
MLQPRNHQATLVPTKASRPGAVGIFRPRRASGWWLATLLLALGSGPGCHSTRTADGPLTRLRIGVGPYFPTPGENRKQFDPLFQELARHVGLPAEIFVTEDWVGLAEVLRAETLDVAWMGPWGFVIARHHEPSLQALATVKYRDRPTYHALLLARADAPFNTLDDALALSHKGPKLKLSLADVGSTSGWLVPQAEFQRRGINPRETFDYNEGAPHAAQAIAVLSGQTDLASDYDRNLDVLVDTGRVDRSKLKVIWQSPPLPNDPIVVRGGLPDEVKSKLQDFLVKLTPDDAQRLLPKNYIGFVASDGGNYSVIETAGKALGKLK